MVFVQSTELARKLRGRGKTHDIPGLKLDRRMIPELPCKLVAQFINCRISNIVPRVPGLLLSAIVASTKARRCWRAQRIDARCMGYAWWAVANTGRLTGGSYSFMVSPRHWVSHFRAVVIAITFGCN